MFTNPDYYEDVLVATQTTFEKTRAMAEGGVYASENFSGKIKVARTGISGAGAAALLGKHLREDFRQSKLGLLNTVSLVIVGGALLATFFIRDLAIIAQIMMWVQVMLIGTGRGLKELYSHYIYLIPESSFSKIVWSNLEITLRTLLESLLIFGVGGLIIQADPAIALICIAVYTIYSFLLLATNYLILRFTGANISSGILLAIYFVIVIIFMLPGIALGFAAMSVLADASGISFGVTLAAWELLVGAVCFLLSKSVLDNCDMPTIKLQ
jgi:hypothetical protein